MTVAGVADDLVEAPDRLPVTVLEGVSGPVRSIAARSMAPARSDETSTTRPLADDDGGGGGGGDDAIRDNVSGDTVVASGRRDFQGGLSNRCFARAFER